MNCRPKSIYTEGDIAVSCDLFLYCVCIISLSYTLSYKKPA